MSIKSLLTLGVVLAGALAFPGEVLARGNGRRGDDDQAGRRGRNRDRVVHQDTIVVDAGINRGRGHPGRRGQNCGRVVHQDTIVVDAGINRGPGQRGRHASNRRFARRGHWGVRTYREWVPGYHRTEYVPPVYKEICGRRGFTIRILVRHGYNHSVFVPGRHVLRTQRVWIPHRRPIFHR